MRSFWRVLLVWLTVLAIPVQGVAAAAMTHCHNATVPMHQHGAHIGHGQPDEHDRSGGHPHEGHHDHRHHHAMNGVGPAEPHAHPATVAETAAPAMMADDTWPAGTEAAREAPAASAHAGKVAGIDKKCSACAACCAAAALPTHVAELPLLDLASTPMSLIDVALVSFIASGPERPPRTHLA